MNKYMLKLGTAVSSAALIASSFVSPALGIDIEVSGNGTNSNNTVNFNTTSNTSVNQTNDADIKNDVDVDADTGKNDANYNTGGDVSITTGDANANATVNNTANANWADVSSCCPGDVNVTVKGNGDNSDNDVIVDLSNNTQVKQDNDADIENDVDVDADTGKNDANHNTGGNVTVDTGDADASAEVNNQLNANGAVVSGNGNGGATLSIEVSGNGSNSDNTVNLDAYSSVYLNQKNDADVKNDVDVDADTGKNDANYNTGGDVSIETGDANASADVSNLANFNWADLDACGCPFDEDSTVKVAGNGDDSDNDVVLDLASSTYARQDNDFDCGNNHHGWWGWWDQDWDREDEPCNDVDVDADTGKNDVEHNTAGGDPSIETGDANANTEVSNEVNVNILGDSEPDFPELPDFGDSASWLIVWLLAQFS